MYDFVLRLFVIVMMMSVVVPAQAQIYSGPDDPTVSPELAARHDKALALRQRADKLFASGDIEGAIKAYRASLEEVITAIGYQGLAVALAKSGQTQEAIVAYRKLLYPSEEKTWGSDNSPLTLMPFALLLNKVGEWQEAVEIYSKGAPFATQGYGNNVPLSVTETFHADTVEPKRFEAAARLALGLELMFRRHEYEEGRVELNKVLALRPNHPLTLFYYGQSYLVDKGDIRAAAPFFAKAERLAVQQSKKPVSDALAATVAMNWRKDGLRGLMNEENAKAKAASADKTPN